MLTFLDGFEHYGTTPNGGRDQMLAGLWADFVLASGGANVSISNTVARTGSYSLKFTPSVSDNNPSRARFVLGGVKFVAGIGYGLYLTSLPGGNQLMGMQFRDIANTPILTLCWNSDGSITIRKGDHTGTVIDITDTSLNAGTQNHVEVKATFDTVAGEVEVRINGIVLTQVGSLNLGSVGAASCSLNMFNSRDSVIHYYDDIFAWDDNGDFNIDFIGPQRVLTLFPAADTATADFAVTGAASGHAAISEVPADGDTSYISTSDVTDKSEFTLPSLPAETAIIAGVMVLSKARIDSAGIGNAQISSVSGSSVLNGPDTALTTGYSYTASFFEYDPATSIVWTKSGLEASLIRVTKTA